MVKFRRAGSGRLGERRTMGRAAWLSPVLVSAALACGLPGAQAQSVSMTGSMGSKALLVVNGSAPKAVAAGDTFQGVKVVSVGGGQAVVEVGGKRMTVEIGGAPIAFKGAGGSGGGGRIVLAESGGGHYVTEGQINGGTVRFVVDTGATMISMGRADADRIGIKYQEGKPVWMNTANGPAQGWKIMLDSVRIQEVTINGVEAVVMPQSMGGLVLLGNSFLSRFKLQRDGETLTLDKRF